MQRHITPARNRSARKRQLARERSKRHYRRKTAGQSVVRLPIDSEAAERMIEEIGWSGPTFAEALAAWFDNVVTPWKRRK
jgi:hypothetical protein